MKQLCDKITTYWNKLNKKNKMMMKTLLIIIVFSIILIGIGSSYSKVEGAYLNDQTVSGLLFSDASLEYNEGLSTYIVNVSNTLESDYSLKNINIIFKDKNDKEIISLVGYIGDNLKISDQKILQASVDKEITNIEKIEYIVNK